MEKLILEPIVDIGGDVPQGNLPHPDGVHIMYPLGKTIILKNTVTNRQTFLQGHTNKVSCISLSRDGSWIASGQQAYMECKANVIVWNFLVAMESTYHTSSPCHVLMIQFSFFLVFSEMIPQASTRLLLFPLPQCSFAEREGISLH